MTKKDAYNLIYSLHAAIENADEEGNLDWPEVAKNLHYEYVDSDLITLLHVGHFGLDCFKKYLEISACLLKDNGLVVSYDEVANGYYNTEAIHSIIARCTEIAELSRKLERAAKSLNNAMLELSTLNPEILK